MADWQWIELSTVLAIHDEQIAEHGGADGLRDLGLLHSALARAQNLAAYGAGAADVADLAGRYASGIIWNHPFVDGNKRTAWVVTETFLELNGHSLEIEESQAVLATLALASKGFTMTDFTEWLRQRLRLFAE